MSEINETIKDLNLLLLYLSGWEEDSKKEKGKTYIRAWKGYLFDVLNALGDDGMILQVMGQKSVILTDDGLKKAKEIKKRLA